MECAHGLPKRYSVSLLNPMAGTISGTAISLSLFLNVKTRPLIPEDDLKSLEQIQRTSVKLVDERTTRVEIQKEKWEEQKKRAKEKATKEEIDKEKKKRAEVEKKRAEEKRKKEEKAKYLKEQREINLRNIERKTHEETLTKDELKEERLDKFFKLVETKLNEIRDSHMNAVFSQWLKEKYPDF